MSPKKLPNKKQRPKKRTFYFKLGLGKKIDYLIENLAMLLDSGMTIETAINAIQEGERSLTMKKVLTALKEDIEAGFPLWKALKRTGLFPAHVVALVKIGEASGKLPENLSLIHI